ncbi:unnamed protein product [Nippostrongylus brasiliensis]|uniref:Maternal effect embryo arrest 59 n=1 Tax=Nippostrongylus brasiliensis TaxID=27835 RepID=A0A0N4YPP3_NIPBR|nr:unnamed protein product [Nippostrongylus brasiliensis]
MYVISMADPNPPDKDQAAWEQFPRLNQEGQEEVRASDKKIQSYIDEEVLNNFNKTVQKRQDGYNVCLPGKDPPVELPDNKKIAAQRLPSVWTLQNEDNDPLAKYHDTGREQLDFGIKEVDEEALGDDGRCDTDPKQRYEDIGFGYHTQNRSTHKAMHSQHGRKSQQTQTVQNTTNSTIRRHDFHNIPVPLWTGNSESKQDANEATSASTRYNIDKACSPTS